MLIYVLVNNPGKINNRVTRNIGINRRSFPAKYDIITKLSSVYGNRGSIGKGSRNS
jgi:hypothetical protein